MNKTTYNNILFALLALFWGGSFVAIKFLIEQVPSFTAAFYRVFFSLIFIFLFSLKSLKLKAPLLSKEVLLSALTGLCSVGIPFSLLFWGERYVSPSLAGVLNGTVPIWTMLIGIIFFKDYSSVSLKKIIGLVLGALGLTIIFSPKITFRGEISEIYGLIAILFMAISYAVGINLNKKVIVNRKMISNRSNILIQQLSSSIYLFLLLLLVDGIPNISLFSKYSVSLSVLYLSLFSTALAFIIFYYLIEQIGPVKSSTVTFYVPAISIILDTILFDRKLQNYEYLGAIIIFLSMICMRDSKKKSR